MTCSLLGFAAIFLAMYTAIPTPHAFAQSKYTVADDLTPVSKWKNGFSAAETKSLRSAYQAGDYIIGNDICAFAYLNISELITTQVVSRGGGIAQLERSPLPEIGDTVAVTDLGKMPLSQALADKRSRMQAIAVLHKGKVVYEIYPGMPENMKHLWASAAKTITGLLIHKLANQGKIDLERPVSTYLDFTKGAPISGIKVVDVLHQRSGLDFEETQANFANPKHPLGRALASSSER